jgi:hypothetical protein
VGLSKNNQKTAKKIEEKIDPLLNNNYSRIIYFFLTKIVTILKINEYSIFPWFLH